MNPRTRKLVRGAGGLIAGMIGLFREEWLANPRAVLSQLGVFQLSHDEFGFARPLVPIEAGAENKSYRCAQGSQFERCLDFSGEFTGGKCDSFGSELLRAEYFLSSIEDCIGDLFIHRSASVDQTIEFHPCIPLV